MGVLPLSGDAVDWATELQNWSFNMYSAFLKKIFIKTDTVSLKPEKNKNNKKHFASKSSLIFTKKDNYFLMWLATKNEFQMIIKKNSAKKAGLILALHVFPISMMTLFSVDDFKGLPLNEIPLSWLKHMNSTLFEFTETNASCCLRQAIQQRFGLSRCICKNH